MRAVQVRRHSSTKKGEWHGSNVSQEGVELARKVGVSLGPFDLVVASTAIRTTETALAMGYAVDDVIEYPDVSDGTGIDFHGWWEWEEPFAEIARIASRNPNTSKAALGVASLWAAVAARLPDGGRVLVVSHGGIMEVGLVGALPVADHASWGSPFTQCEGFELTYDGARFTSARFFRGP